MLINESFHFFINGTMCQGRHKHYHKFDLIIKDIVAGILNIIDRNLFFAIEIKTLFQFRNIT